MMISRLFSLLSSLALVGAFTLNTASTRRRPSPTTSTRQSLALWLSSSPSAADEEKRMEMVRALQKTFYTQDDNEDDSLATTLEPDSGRMTNVPLWRVGWVEVPGRANCLNVHEGHYTNMFEKILSGPKPWYFGHLHLPGGTKAARTGESRFELKDWQAEVQDDARFDEKERSAVVGCLMRVTDYRRLSDGRLTLLVHGLERFVVDEVVQTFPNGIAHVQIVPDLEAFLPNIDLAVDENFGKSARAAAVRESFQYHEYECDPIELPLPQDSEYMSSQNVLGVEIAKCLPFAFFNPDDSMLDRITTTPSVVSPVVVVVPSDDKEETDTTLDRFAGGQPLLEARLQADLILRNPAPLAGVQRRDTQDVNAVETLLWLALEDFCRATRFVLPEEVLCLMPPHMDYLDMVPPKQFVSTKYPALRRQQRLSYAVPALIENTNLGEAGVMRQVWLNTPSTRARLAAVLERFQMINDALVGEFE